MPYPPRLTPTERDDVAWLHTRHDLTVIDLAQAFGTTQPTIRLALKKAGVFRSRRVTPSTPPE